MKLALQNFTQLMQTMSAAMQGACAQLVDLTVGSTLRAVLEANAAVALWMQWLILQVLSMTRAATSNGADLDSWMADFGLSRMPAAAATGIVTLSRFTPSLQALVPAGAQVRTADGAQTFTVVAAPAVAAWDGRLSAYVLQSGTAGLDVPVVAQAAGVAGNVQAGSISLLATALPGIDTVQNRAALQGGLDAEPDDALRVRFQNYINTRSRATVAAVGYAIAAIQQGLNYTIVENHDPSGAWRPGAFVVTVDDGTGKPSASLLQTVIAAVEAVRPIGSILSVRGPGVLTADISLTLTLAPTASRSAAGAAVAAAVTGYVNGLPIGAALAWSRIAQLAYAADPGVTNVTALLVNGGTADVAPQAWQVVKAGIVAVN